MNSSRSFFVFAFCWYLLLFQCNIALTQDVHDYRSYSWSPTKENWDFENAIVVRQPSSGAVFLNSSGSLVYGNGNAEINTDEFELLVGSENLVASVVVTVDKLTGTTGYKFSGVNTATPPVGGNSGTVLGTVGSPTTLPGSTVTGTVVGLPGTNAPIPTSGTVKIFVSDATVENDSWSIWWDLGGTGTYYDGVKSWSDVRDGLFPLDNGSVDVIVISGHGAGSGGTHTNDPNSELDEPSLTESAIEVIKNSASDDAVIVILSCSQGQGPYLNGIQDLSNILGLPIIVNSGSVSSGTNGAGDWIRVDPTITVPTPPSQSGGN